MRYSQFYNDYLDHQFISLAIQYFLLARFGSQFPFNPVSGSLYHLFFELLLKSYLIKNGFTASELASKEWGHKLSKLWEVFKEKVGDKNLKKYDLLVKNLDAWEKVRYISLKGKNASRIEIVKGFAGKLYLDEIEELNYASQEGFTLYTGDMDELFYTFFSTLRIPPEELLKVPDFVWGKAIYEKDNEYNYLTNKSKSDFFPKGSIV